MFWESFGDVLFSREVRIYIQVSSTSNLCYASKTNVELSLRCKSASLV